MSSMSQYDYIIVGNGLAGLKLALKMASDSFFDEKLIALIDTSEKKTNDKTWSFWETKSSQWKDIAHKSWNKASIITSKKNIDLELNPYSYKAIQAIDFYIYAKKKLSKKGNIRFIVEHVESITEDDIVKVSTNKTTYTAGHVFDSRIPETFSVNSKKHISIIQHFKGWVIKTDNNFVFQKFSLLVAIDNTKCISYKLYDKGSVNSDRFNDFLKRVYTGKERQVLRNSITVFRNIARRWIGNQQTVSSCRCFLTLTITRREGFKL